MKPIVSVINQEWVDKYRPCLAAVEKYRRLKNKDPLTILNKLIKDKQYVWADWFIVRIMEHKDYVAYGLFAAKTNCCWA